MNTQGKRAVRVRAAEEGDELAAELEAVAAAVEVPHPP